MLQSANNTISPPVFFAGPLQFNAAVDAWEARQRAAEELAELYPLQTELHASLPRWAQYGPRMINGEGEWSEDCCGWPEAEHYELPAVSYGWRPVRVSPYDVLHDYNTRLCMLGNPEGKNYAAWRATARAQMRARMRKVILRIREQRQLQAEIGLTALADRVEAVVDSLIAAEDAIRNLHESPDQAAALIMVNADDECQPSATIAGDHRDGTMEIAAVALRLLLPNLSGLIRDHAHFFISNPTAPLRDMPFKVPQ